MSEHLPDVELTDAQEARARALLSAEIVEVPGAQLRAARLIVHLQDRVAALEEIPTVVESESGNPGWVSAKDAVKLLAEARKRKQPLTWETFWQAVRESNWTPSPDDLRKILNRQIEQGAGPEIPACIAVTTPDVRDVDCPACGKPMSEHKGELGPGAVLWCP